MRCRAKTTQPYSTKTEREVINHTKFGNDGSKEYKITSVLSIGHIATYTCSKWIKHMTPLVAVVHTL